MIVNTSQLKKLDEIAKNNFVKSLQFKYRNLADESIINLSNLNSWVIEARKYGIINEIEVENFIELKIIINKLNYDPFDNMILYYLTHPNLSNLEKMDIIKTNILTI